MSTKILLIYTGGTIGMVRNEAGQLMPFNFENLLHQIPEIGQLGCDVNAIGFDEPVDSSVMNTSHWKRIAHMVADNYESYDGFVILHGSDTMAYTSSALSFMLKGLNKPVIMTGSQLPIGILRSDARENLITSMEIAAAKNPDGSPKVPEVAVYFEYNLYRGNRLFKYSSQNFEAYQSPNYPLLAEAGVTLKFHDSYIRKVDNEPFELLDDLDSSVAILPLFPGIDRALVESVLLKSQRKAVLLRTYGAGNGPTDEWFIDLLKEAISRGVILINVSQCRAGSVDQTKYDAGIRLHEIGVLGSGDMTLEAALTKTMHLLGRKHETEVFKLHYLSEIRGEMGN